MSALEIWLVIAGMTVVTTIMCPLFLIIDDHMTLPTRVQHALRFVPVAVLVTIVSPDLLWNQDHFDANWTGPRLMTGIAATAFYVATRHTLGMIFVDMGVFTVLRPWR